MGKSTRAYCKTNTSKWHNGICRSSHSPAKAIAGCFCVSFGKNKSSRGMFGPYILTVAAMKVKKKKRANCIYAGVRWRQRRALAQVLGVHLKTCSWQQMCTDQNGWNNNFVDDMRVILAVPSSGSSLLSFEMANSELDDEVGDDGNDDMATVLHRWGRVARFRQLFRLVWE